ncbi:MAG TPA: TetR/AcrR family transcriptional regulator, partial [Rubrivivax sp.]|nr:TetR/AcrR family transcriptional regulator [Rubrivivax sp.]
PSRKARVRRIVEAFVAPVLERAPDAPQTYALLAARELLTRDTPLNRQVLREQFDPMAHAFIDALSQTFPDATRGQAAWCYQFALGAFVHHLTDHRVERLSRGENRRRDPAGAAMLTRFIVGGILEALTSRRAAAT